MNELSKYLVLQAQNNCWSNHRLLRACSQLSQPAFAAADRTSFFPSIRHTLNHILTVDWFYLDALERDINGEPPHPDYESFFAQEEPFADCTGLRAAQLASDQRLIAYCQRLEDASIGQTVSILRGDRTQRDTRGKLLAHMFQHQTHHRGQVHAMLAGTPVEPPQLDEFFSSGEWDLRVDDFRELGWTEEQVFGVAAPA